MRRTRIEVPAAGIIMRRVAQVAMSALICCTLAAPLGATENRSRPRATKAERARHLERQRHLAQQHHRLSEAQMQKRAEHQRRGKPFRALVSLRVALEHGTQGHSHEQAAIKADAEQNQHKLTPDKQARAESRLDSIAKEKRKLEEAARTLDTLLVFALLHKMKLEALERTSSPNFIVDPEGQTRRPEKEAPEPTHQPLRLIETRALVPSPSVQNSRPKLVVIEGGRPERLRITHEPTRKTSHPELTLLSDGKDRVAPRQKRLAPPNRELIPATGNQLAEPVTKSTNLVPFATAVAGAMAESGNDRNIGIEWGPWKGRTSGAGPRAQQVPPKGQSAVLERRMIKLAKDQGRAAAKKYYREEAQKNHPDKTMDLSEAAKAARLDRFHELGDAWSRVQEQWKKEDQRAARGAADFARTGTEGY